MKNIVKGTILYIVLSIPVIALAQKGNIRGTVIEDATGEPMIGVTVLIKGTTTGAVTDFDGKFDISAEPGTYDLQISFVSFQTIQIAGLIVNPGKVTLIDQIRMLENVDVLEEVVITAEVIKTTETALLTVKRKSANLMDGISAANFKLMGDGDASEAVKRVTGVSVEGGKYVYVRGLGDRYTKTMLNGMDVPGLDPDRNSLQMDIFPTDLIANMIVLKTAVAEMPADFTGGVVNIETKDFPDYRVLDVSVGVGYNPSMHFNKNYLTYEGGKTDFLGFDDGTRALPEAAYLDNIPSPISGNSSQEVNAFLNEFNPTLGAYQKRSFMDFNLGVSYADQKTISGERKLGYIFSLTYKNATAFYDDVTYGEYQRFMDPDLYRLRYATIQNGSLGENSVLLGGLAGVALKSGNNKYKLTLMHLQNGESKAGQFRIVNDGEAVGQSGYIATSDNLEYSQRGLTNLLLNGEHYNSDATWKIDWRVSPTYSKILEPDIRKTAFTLESTDTAFFAGAGGNPTRIWRELNEINVAGKVDLTREYEMLGAGAKLKFGASHVFKYRDYEIRSYDVQFFGAQPDFGYDPNNVLDNENLYPNGTVYYSSGNNSPNPNEYQGNAQNTGLYVSNEFNVNPELKAILGLRAENYVMRHTGRDVEYANSGSSGNNLDNEVVLNSLHLFPSSNVIYALTDEQNLRFAYSRTIARPSFKELSFAQILDPITNRIFNGGLFQYNDWDGNLTETLIDNLDLRWEMFKDKGQLFSLSAFYKHFDDPIELVRIPEQQTSTEYQPRNVGDGTVVGAEIEIRKALDFVAPSLTNWSLSGNVTVVESRIDMTDVEFNARKQYEKTGESVKDFRQMAGQAPYIINAGVAYQNQDKGMDAGLFYNVKGPTLWIVGGGLFPDIYAQPFHSLNFNMNKTFGEDRRSALSVSASNLLNDVREEMYTGYKAANKPFTRFSPGMALSLGYKYSF